MTIEQLQAEALKLPRHVRARLAEALISSLDEDSEIEQAWEDEAEARYRRYLAGEEEVVPVADALPGSGPSSSPDGGSPPSRCPCGSSSGSAFLREGG